MLLPSEPFIQPQNYFFKRNSTGQYSLGKVLMQWTLLSLTNSAAEFENSNFHGQSNIHYLTSLSNCIYAMAFLTAFGQAPFTQGWVISVGRYSLETKDLPQTPAYLPL